MKASYNWLKKMVPGLTAAPNELTDRLTRVGLEVEGTHWYGEGATRCHVAKVLSMKPHPSKSGLRLVTVDTGSGNLEVVCGAANVPEPQGLVVLAPLGAYLPAKQVTIATRDIGGVASTGMLVSEVELGLSEESDGIIVLPRGSSSPGAPFHAAFPEVTDHIFEINVTPNRGDCLGHIGIAREIAALYGFPWKLSPKPWTLSSLTVESLEIKLQVENTDQCSRYAVMGAVGVSVARSPEWLRYRLASLGIRPISNIVDVTNHVLLEFGHPIHAFDLDRLESGSSGLIQVRNARSGEELVTLDGVTRTLTDDDLLICDGKKPIALAGVMGGKSTEIHSGTKRVLFECAVFNSRSVRRTARRHGIHTDASHRFERGVDPSDIDAVLAATTELTAKLSSAQIATGKVEREGPLQFPKSVMLRAERVREIIGMDIPFAESLATLERLGCTLRNPGGARSEVLAPPHRHDLTREVDFVEEIIRVHGMDTIPEQIPAIRPSRDIRDASDSFQGQRGENRDALEVRARHACILAGLSEAIVLGMTSKKSLADAKVAEASVILKNPLSELGAVMRTSLLPGLLDAVTRAKRHEVRDARIFAVGRVFFQGPTGLPEERLRATVVVSGYRHPYLAKPEPVDVWDMKGIALHVVKTLVGVEPSLHLPTEGEHVPFLHPRASAELRVDGMAVGHFGLVHPDVCDAWDLPHHPLATLELDLEVIDRLPQRKALFATLPRFPGNARDIAVVVRANLAAGEVLHTIREACGPWAAEVSLFDRFSGGTIAHDHVSLGFRVLYRATDRTLTDLEVDAHHQKVIAAVQARYHASIRASTLQGSTLQDSPEDGADDKKLGHTLAQT